MFNIIERPLNSLYIVSQKSKLGNNFGKCGPIFKISWFVRKFSMYTWQRFLPHLQYVAALPCESWKSKCYWIWQHPQQTVDMFPKTLWALDLAFTVSRILTEWLTFWSSSNGVSNQQLNVVQLNVVASWWFFHPDYLCTVFVLSILLIHVVHIFK